MDSQESSPTLQLESINSSALSLLNGPNFTSIDNSYMTTGKNITFTIWTFVGKVMLPLFNILYRFVIAFLPRSKRPFMFFFFYLFYFIFKLYNIVLALPNIEMNPPQVIERRLFLRRKVMTNLDSVLKSRRITLPTKV